KTPSKPRWICWAFMFTLLIFAVGKRYSNDSFAAGYLVHILKIQFQKACVSFTFFSNLRAIRAMMNCSNPRLAISTMRFGTLFVYKSLMLDTISHCGKDGLMKLW